MEAAATTTRGPGEPRPGLSRSLSLPLAVLFGLGVTIGAGIYVLIGAAAGRAGFHAPIAFILAAIVMAPTAATFAEFAARLPVSAGEAAYVRAGFRSEALSLIVGMLVICVAMLSAAAIGRGSAGYVGQLTHLPVEPAVILVVLSMGAVTAWGIRESALLAGFMTLIEIGGLVAIVVVGAWQSPAMFSRLPEIWTGASSLAGMTGILAATMLAFFAFIGFESLANVAEEVREPERTLPRAIFLTLAISTVLYIAVVWVALIAVPQSELARSQAPLSLVFERVTGASPVLITCIAIVATINGLIVQMVMASRVIYGLADRKLLPEFLRRIHPATQTPLYATAITVGIVLLLGLLLPLERLADLTSRVTLVILALVNAALALMKLRADTDDRPGFRVRTWVPVTGFLACTALLVADLVVRTYLH